MSNKIRISIKQPCNKKFDSFKPTQSGGFCSSCQKTVMDFSEMSDSEILDYFKDNKGNTCGRFKKSQLKAYPENKCLNPKHNSMATRTGLLSIPFLSLLPITNSQALSSDVQPSAQVHQVEIADKASKAITSHEDSLVSGIVTDGDQTIPFVTVHLKGTSYGTTTDIDGKFEFPAPLSIGDILVFSFVGYKTEEVTIADNTDLSISLEVELVEEEIVMMGEVSIEQQYSSHKTLWEKLKALF